MTDSIQLTSRVYQTVLEKLNSKKPTSLEVLKANIEGSLEGVNLQPGDLTLIPLDRRPRPTLLVKFHCFSGVSEAYSSFRLFKYSDGQYKIATLSGQEAVLSQVDEFGRSVDQSLLTVTVLDNGDPNRQYILTDWTRAGSSPAPFSIIIWEWDGESLRPIWQRLNLRQATMTVIGGVIMLALKTSDQTLGGETEQQTTWRREMYRLSKTSIVFDGLLNQELIERYLRDRDIVADNAEILVKLGHLWYASGAINKATQSYEDALKSDSSQRFRHLYLFLADLYEKQEQYHEAINLLERYRNLVDEKLTLEGRQKINSQIQGLQEKARRKQRNP